MIKIIYIYLFLLIFNCASQSMPQGGPKDVRAPIKVKEIPLNKKNISKYDKITIEFDERINPNSIINSISISPDINVDVKAKGNKIIINPLSEWPKEVPIEININRNLSDFQLNNINNEIQLIYNIQSDDYCSIRGKLINGLEKTHNIYVYKWPEINFENPIKKINSDINNHFIINYLKPGKYILIASEGNLDIHNNRYGMLPYKYIDLDSNNCDKDISIYMDDPLEKVKISRVETINSRLLSISYSNNTIEPYVLELENNNQDSLYINIKKKNRLEEYSLEPYLYLRRNVIDTIPPFISSLDDFDDMAIINFSEPINKDSLFIFGLADNSLDEDEWINVEYENLNSMSIKILKNSLKEIKFIGEFIQDFSQNKMLDSMEVYIFKDKSMDSYGAQGFGSLKGKILNPLDKNIIVEAKNISLNLLYTEIVKDSSFIFKDLSPGKYIFRAYEDKSFIGSQVYFSGTLEPYRNAANFSIYKDTVEVRKFWDIEGVDIEF